LNVDDFKMKTKCYSIILLMMMMMMTSLHENNEPNEIENVD